MKNLFRFLHIVNLLLLFATLGTYIFSKSGMACQMWLGIVQLSFGIIQLVSLRFFTSETKTMVGLYWALVGFWIVVCIGLSTINAVMHTIMIVIVPLLIACYSVYVGWHTLKDITKLSDEEAQ